MKETKATNHLHETEPRWFAVYTRFKSEKVVKRLLEKKGIETYLPLQRKTRRYTRKIKQVDLPLITCYVFVRIIRKEYLTVLQTENVVKFLRLSSDLVSIPESEINLMKRVVGESFPITAEPTTFGIGDYVEVIAGNLTGLKGRLLSRQGKNAFLVDLETIGYSLQIGIDTNLLSRLERQAG